MLDADLTSILGLFVHRPLRLLMMAVFFLLLWAGRRHRRGQAGKGRYALLVPFAFFTVFAAWEWLVTARTPEANIRVDLLLIWPAALVVVVWSLIRTLRR
jgi:hypothetical protein